MVKGYRPMPMEPDGVFYARRIARKEYPCSVREGCTIKPGEEYVDQVTAPWTMMVDDVTDDGRPTGPLLGHWERSRYHAHPVYLPPLRETPHPVDMGDGWSIRSHRLPPSVDPSNRLGGGDPMADYLHAKGEL